MSFLESERQKNKTDSEQNEQRKLWKVQRKEHKVLGPSQISNYVYILKNTSVSDTFAHGARSVWPTHAHSCPESHLWCLCGRNHASG